LNFHCNICTVDVDEKKIEAHLNSKEHQLNKRRILDTKEKGEENPKGVVQIWLESLNTK